jgi:hypothetical protein
VEDAGRDGCFANSRRVIGRVPLGELFQRCSLRACGGMVEHKGGLCTGGRVSGQQHFETGEAMENSKGRRMSILSTPTPKQ